MASRLWTPADMAGGPRIWIDGNGQTDVQPNGVVTEIQAARGGPTTYGGASAQYRAVLQADAGGRKWLCAPLWTADFSPAGITPPGTARMVPNASFPSVSDALTAPAIEALCITRRAADSTQTGVMVVLQSGSTAEMSLGFRRQPGSITAYGYAGGATRTAVGTSGVSAGATLARGFFDYSVGKIGVAISGASPIESTFTAPASGHWEPATVATWAAPQVCQQNYDTAEALIFYRRLTSDEAAKLEGYLAHRWGIADALPDSHPYKAAPPQVDEPLPPAPQPVPETAPEGFLLERPAKGQTWASLAFRYYYDEAQFPRLIEANPALADVQVFEGTEAVLVPIIPAEELASAEASTPPWRR